MNLANKKKQRIAAALYFIGLAVAMWMPLGGIHLNKMVFGFRLDHLLHLAIYVPCALAWSVLLPGRRWLWLVLTLLVGAGLEATQYVLPYRGFDLTDMVANATGALLGWIALIAYAIRIRHKDNGSY